MLRLAGLIAGLLLAWQGAGLAYDEFALVDARHVARDGRPQRLRAHTEKLEVAYSTLSAARAAREDVSAAELDLVLELESREAGMDASRGSAHRARIRQTAHDLARTSPMNAHAWCVLALANAKSAGVTPAVADQLKACYEFGPRDAGLVEGRLAFALAAWDALPLDMRNMAMIDVAVALGDEVYDQRMTHWLARSVSTIAPARAPLAGTMIDTYGGRLKSMYERALDHYRNGAKQRKYNR